MDNFIVLLSPFIVYIGFVTSPGPATLAIMNISMKLGRKEGLIFTSGIICGALTWGGITFFGLSTVILQNQLLFDAIKMVGAIYLLWLAYRSLKTALEDKALQSKQINVNSSYTLLYIQGLGLHLTNPKAILAWSTVLSLVYNYESVTQLTIIICYLICAVIGVSVFFSYVFLFSTASMIRLYTKYKRNISFFMFALFLIASISLLIYRP